MKKKPISIYPDDALRSRIEAAAADADRSVNYVLLRALEDAFPEPRARVATTVVASPAPRSGRTTTCHHNIPPDAHCKVCDR